MPGRGALLVAGATSGAGKSTVVAGLCRWFARGGASVSPFKAQNMSNHSAVAVDGGEVGRAQAVQAAAAGVDVEVAMGPILLKPSSETGGVLPHLGPEPLLGGEDSLDVPAGRIGGTAGADPVRVAAVRLPHLANPSDLDPLLGEADVSLRWATTPGDVEDVDLVVVPGSRATVADLGWLRRAGVGEAIGRARAGGAVVLGICAGHQVLGRRIVDDVESGAGEVDGLGLLDAETTFAADKVVARRRAVSCHARLGRHDLAGYQIHLGRSVGTRPWLRLDDGRTEGSASEDGGVLGTSLHGLLDADEFRSALLAHVAERRGRTFRPSPVPFADRLAAQHDRLADWLDDHLDTGAVSALAATAAPPGGGPGWG